MVNNGIVVLISGRGSNLNAIINAVNDGVIKYPIAAVVSDRYCEGVEISRRYKLNTLVTVSYTHLTLPTTVSV